MTKDNLEFYLNRGNNLGFNTDDGADIVGWLILTKRLPNESLLKRFDEADDPVRYQAQMKIMQEPYMILIAKVARETFESNEISSNDDYLLNTNYTFSTLDEAEIFMKQLGYKLSDLKWPIDFEFL